MLFCSEKAQTSTEITGWALHTSASDWEADLRVKRSKWILSAVARVLFYFLFFLMHGTFMKFYCWCSDWLISLMMDGHRFQESCMARKHVMKLDLSFAVSQEEWKESVCKTALWIMFSSRSWTDFIIVVLWGNKFPENGRVIIRRFITSSTCDPKWWVLQLHFQNYTD